MVLGWWWGYPWWRVLLCPAPFTPSLCPPNGYLQECSVTRLFLDKAVSNTPTGSISASITSSYHSVWQVKPEFVPAFLFCFYHICWERQLLAVSCSALRRSIIILTPGVRLPLKVWRYLKVLRCLLKIAGQDWGTTGVCWGEKPEKGAMAFFFF